MAFYVYIVASKRNGTIYTGTTDNLVQRIYQHRAGLVRGFTKQHGATQLVWFESHQTRADALLRERQIKKWNRAWKLEMIELENPQWKDLWEDIVT